MNNFDKELPSRKNEFIEFLEKASSDDYKSRKSSQIKMKNKEKGIIHLNSLITKNISLFTNNPNYKLLTWLIIQLIIFSLFIFTVTIFKNNIIPYFNTL